MKKLWVLGIASLISAGTFGDVLSKAGKTVISGAETISLVKGVVGGTISEAKVIEALGTGQGKTFFAAISTLKATGKLGSQTDFAALAAVSKDLTSDSIAADFQAMANGSASGGKVSAFFTSAQTNASADMATPIASTDPVDAVKALNPTDPSEREYVSNLVDRYEGGSNEASEELHRVGEVAIAFQQEAASAPAAERAVLAPLAREIPAAYGAAGLAKGGEAPLGFAKREVAPGFLTETVRHLKQVYWTGYLRAVRMLRMGLLGEPTKVCVLGQAA